MSQTPPPPPPPGSGTPGDDEPGPRPDYGQPSGAGDGYTQPDYRHPGGEQTPGYGQEYAQPGYGDGPGAPASGTNTKAVVALVLGILSLVCCGLVTGIPAIILGPMARKETSSTGESGDGLAIAGIVTGAIGVLWSLIVGILVVAGVVEVFQFQESTDLGGGSGF